MAGIGDESMSCPKYPATDQIGVPQAEAIVIGAGTGAFYKLYPDDEKPVVKTSNRTGCWVRGNFFTFPTDITSRASTLRCTVEGMLWHFRGGLPECLGCFSVGDHFLPDQSMYSLNSGKVCTCNCNQRMDQQCLVALLDEGVVLKEESNGESIMDERAENAEQNSKDRMAGSDKTNASIDKPSIEGNYNCSQKEDEGEAVASRNVIPELFPELEDEDEESRMNNEPLKKFSPGRKVNEEEKEEEDEEKEKEEKEMRWMHTKTGCSVAGTFYTFPFSTFGSFCRCTEHGMLWCWKGGVPSCLGCLVDGLHFSPSSSYTLASGTVCTCTCSQQMDKECHQGPLDSKPWKGMAWHIE